MLSRSENVGKHYSIQSKLVRHSSFQVCDKIKHPVVASIIGNICLIMGFLFVGPAPLFQDLVPTSQLIKSSGAVLGTGFAMVTVSTFGRSQAAAIRNGYNDDLDTYMFISSKLG